MLENLKAIGLLGLWLLAGVGFVTLLDGRISRATASSIWVVGSLVALLLNYELRKDRQQEDEPPTDG